MALSDRQRSLCAALAAAGTAYFGGAVGIDLAGLYAAMMQGDIDHSQRFDTIAAALMGLLYVVGFVVIAVLALLAWLLHLGLRALGWTDVTAYAGAGGVFGLVPSVLLLRLLTNNSDRVDGIIAAVIIGALAGTAFWAVRRPDQAPAAPRRRFSGPANWG